MKNVLLLVFVLFANFTVGQKISHLVMVGPNGITQDPDKATSFVVVKEYPNARYERMDYNKGGPMMMLRTYKGSDLKILDGRYLQYAESGALELMGQYAENQKTGHWYSFNDTGKVISKVLYDHDTLVLDNEDHVKDSVTSYPDEREASFPGGLSAWQKYIVRSLEKSKTAEKAFTEGKVYVSFKIDPEGYVQDVFVSRSVEFIIDEESVDIIKKSPKWNPAFQNGKYVSAYRRQPVSFLKQ